MDKTGKIMLGTFAASLIALGSLITGTNLKYERLFQKSDIKIEATSAGMTEKVGGFYTKGELDRIVVIESAYGIFNTDIFSDYQDLTPSDKNFAEYKNLLEMRLSR